MRANEWKKKNRTKQKNVKYVCKFLIYLLRDTDDVFLFFFFFLLLSSFFSKFCSSHHLAAEAKINDGNEGEKQTQRINFTINNLCKIRGFQKKKKKVLQLEHRRCSRKMTWISHIIWWKKKKAKGKKWPINNSSATKTVESIGTWN